MQVHLHITTADSIPMPGGTQDQPFVYTISPKVAGGFTATLSDAGMTVTFPDVPEGDYTATATKFGVSVNADFVVIAPVKFQIPATVSVSLT